MTGDQIAAALSNPSSDAGKAIIGAANAIIAALCQLTGGQPGAVCASPSVTAFKGKL